MQSWKALRTQKRQARFERFEERIALSAQPIATLLPVDVPLERHYEELTPVDAADFRVNVELVQQVENHVGSLNPWLESAHQSTGVNYVHSTYGFGGQGQTVAIIDSGIAYDHYSLGTGFGAQYRVVGGYDFAEGDTNPYDDGPAGFHGTHVAGIVGSDHATHRGVAPDVDLVALRVFDDDGAGFFSWVESALAWVHTHRNDFANPITTVNLSLGTTWNSEEIPSWTTIEDELAQLEADGIFVTASAGNSFEDYNTAGLSYPAASDFLVPVSSVGADGQFSSFSQRSGRVLAAPGESIVSTVPDHVFGANNVPNDFGAASGTSMAAPYVAGASALVRQAMEFVGMQGITQDAIYDHLRNTADIFFDTATNANYHRINVQAALDALMPADDFGSTVATAHDLGVLSDQLTQNGLIGKLNDLDYFTFTAGATGTVNMTVDGDHELVPDLDVTGATGTENGNSLSFDVIGGQSYSVSVATTQGGGIGFYDAELTLQASAIELGTVASSRLTDQNLSSPVTWYQLSATRAGTLTAEAIFSHAAGDVDLELYSGSGQLLASSSSTTDNERIDVSASGGEDFLVKVSGTNSDVDLRFTNLLSSANGELAVHGTAANDTVVANLSSLELTVNGVVYSNALFNIGNTMVYAGAGSDLVTVHGTSSMETAAFEVGLLNVANSSQRVQVFDAETSIVFSGGGSDRAVVFDSVGNDQYVGREDTSILYGTGFRHEMHNYSEVYVHSVNGGYDQAELYDGLLDDHFVGRADSSVMYADDYSFYNVAYNFDQVEAHATNGGYDRAYMHDSASNDHFVARADFSVMYADDYSFYNVANEFERVDGYSTNGGYDRAYMHDSEDHDFFVGLADRGLLYAADYSFYNLAHGFTEVDAYASNGGYDRAYLHGSSGNDIFVGRPENSALYAADFSHYNMTHGFEQVDAFATPGGYDRAILYDGATNDFLVARSDSAVLYASDYSFYNMAHGFDQVDAHATAGGYNRAYLYDAATDDYFVGRELSSVLYASDYSFYNVAHAFSQVDAHSTAGGNDLAFLYGSAGDDFFVGRPDHSVLYASDYSFYNIAYGFKQVDADASSGGNDRAFFFDSIGDESFAAGGTVAELSGLGFYFRARHFDRVDVSGAAGGHDSATYYDVESSDSVFGRSNYSTLNTLLTTIRVEEFEELDAIAMNGNSPSADVVAVDYLFQSVGNWN